MATTIPPPTKLKIASEPESPSTLELKPLMGDAPKASLEWSLGRAWRLRQLCGPLVKAAEALVLGSRAAMEGQFTFRVLVIGRETAALSGMLSIAASRKLQFQVRAIERDGDNLVPFEAETFDCVIAIDWLPLIRPSQRESAVAELCRIARLGVLIVNPFHTPEVAASERAVNALYLAATGNDNPVLGRHLEYGLPELDRTREWVVAAFPNVISEPIEALATWRLFASVAVHESNGEVTAEEAAVAALLPPVDAAVQGPAYRTVLVGSSSQLSSTTTTRVHNADSAALGAHLAIEAAAQRRALDRLTEAVSTENERARDEFRTTVASLASELREREAYAEMLAANFKERESEIANQNAVIESLERRLGESDTHYRNLESERDALRERVRNLEDEKEGASNHVRALENARGVALSQVHNLENQRHVALTQIRDLENERHVALTQIRDLENEREAVNRQLRDLADQSEAIAVQFEERLAALSRELLDKQIQLNGITSSVGWRVLSRYGRFKYRFLLPVYRLFGQTSSEQTEPKLRQDNAD